MPLNLVTKISERYNITDRSKQTQPIGTFAWEFSPTTLVKTPAPNVPPLAIFCPLFRKK